MANLHGDLPVEVRRILFVKKRMWERGGKDFAKGEEIVRKLADVAIDAVQQFDRNEYLNDWEKFFDTDQLEATQAGMMIRVFNFGGEKIQEWCDNHHERPKTCDCLTLQRLLMGIVPAIEPLPELPIEEEGEKA